MGGQLGSLGPPSIKAANGAAVNLVMLLLGNANEVIVYREIMYVKPLQSVQSLYSKPKGQVITGKFRYFIV